MEATKPFSENYLENTENQSKLKLLPWSIYTQTIFQNPWIPKSNIKGNPYRPTAKQALFLRSENLEALYGGAAGPGKTEAILLGALMFVQMRGYSALILRRSYGDLNQPDAIMDRCHQWIRGKEVNGEEAHWNGKDYIYTFPSGAKIQFGYLKNDADKYRYQGAMYQYIGFDELTQFTEAQYLYLFSRLRRLEGVDIPLRMRGATNPGGIGHTWVKERFVDQGWVYDFDSYDYRIFIPALLHENPYLDVEDYMKSLRKLGATERERLLNGDWSVSDLGGKFRREWFPIVDSYPLGKPAVRYWDLAATSTKDASDPDYTVGLLMIRDGGQFYIVDIIRERETPSVVESIIKRAARVDHMRMRNGDVYYTETYMEQEPGASGKALVDHYARNILTGYSFRGSKISGDKEMRANPVSAAAENGNVFLVRGHWNKSFLDEIELFPYGAHDDQVDAMSGAFSKLAELPEGEIEIGYARRTW